MKNLRKYRFSDLYSMGSGISSKPEQAGHGAPFLSFSTVFNNYFIPDQLSDLMDTSDKEQDTYSVKKGDIFLTRTSETIDELGMSCVALKDYPRATFSGFVKRLRPKQKNITYPKFMGFYLRSAFFRKIMTNNAIMTLRASLNEEIFSYLNLYLPDFETQKKIGDALFLLNSKIELNNRINAELESMTKTIYDYWFVQYDFPNATGTPYKASGGKMVWSEELKREIPVGWSKTTVGEILIKDKATYKVPSTEYVDAGKIPVIDQSTDFIAGFSDNLDALIRAEQPRIVFGDHTRIVKFINFDFARGADGTQILLSAEKRMPQHLFYHALLKIDLSNYGYARHFKFLKEQSLLLPEQSISERFERIVLPFFERIRHNIFENQKLSELRDWLLPMLLNGQVKVGEVEHELELAAEPGVAYSKLKK